MAKEIFYRLDLKTKISRPLFVNGLYASFISPALQYSALTIDLNMALLLDADNTRIYTVQDDDLAEENKIYKGDWAILDTDLPPYDGDKVSCRLFGDDINRKISTDENKNRVLSATNKRIKEQTLLPGMDYQVNGVITYTVTPHYYGELSANGEGKNTVDLNQLLIKNKTSTFFGLVEGDSMINAKIHNFDIAVIDRSLGYNNGCKAVFRVGDKFTIKYLEQRKGSLWLVPANDEMKPMLVNDEMVEVWGIVTHTITSHIRSFEAIFEP